MVVFPTTEVPGTGVPGVEVLQEAGVVGTLMVRIVPGVEALQEAGVVGTLTVRIDSAVVAGALGLTTIVGQMMTGQAVGENQTVPRPLVAAHHLMAAVAHHPSVVAHHPSVVGRGKLRKILCNVAKLAILGSCYPGIGSSLGSSLRATWYFLHQA
jgi:hypothetical protein